MKPFNQKLSAMIFCLLQALLGILLLVNPVGFTSGIIIGLGIVLLIAGAISIVRYFRSSAVEAAKSQTMLKGLIALLFGVFCVFNPHWFLATFPVLTIFYGIVLLIEGLGKVQWMFDMIRMKTKRWFLAVISTVLSILCAVVILSNPFTSTAVLWIFTGVSLIVDALLDMIAVFASGNDRNLGEAETQ